ncbi:RMD1 family protein [Gallaecimonas kandeliae]|uniref:RMD1 family protein n=1 Tax=Gallaecimonas kandeliae TaxID=3029055 RepID=UPI002648E616|nr:RMD1 family protein [Gallaecimonas kandeliae]WKE65455.1 RMD1 family protein [Gallaecimonas kandeliae]
MSHSACFSYCLGNRFNLEKLAPLLAEEGQSQRFKDATLVSLHQGLAFAFDYGALVCWGLPLDDVQALCARLAPAVEEPLAKAPFDEISFALNRQLDRLHIQHDHFQLPDDAPLAKLAISHALAQSVVLEAFEQQVTVNIRDTAFIPEALAEKGRIRLGRRRLAKLRGRLHLAKSEVNLHFDLLDKPEFFWDHPELDPYYDLSRANQELDSRLAILNKRLEVIGELLAILADEEHHRHSSFLEWIIIWLIVIEILIFVFHDYLRWF